MIEKRRLKQIESDCRGFRKLLSHTNAEDVSTVLQDIGRLETRLSGEVSDEVFDELEELHSAIFVDLRRRGIVTPSNFEEFLPILP